MDTDDLKDLALAAVLLLAFMAGVFVVIGTLNSVSMAWQCSNYEEVTNIPTDYVFPNGCFLEIDGKQVYYGEYRDRMIAEKGLSK